jgi:3-oxoacyl-[acyl-carrier-protein] synthase-1
MRPAYVVATGARTALGLDDTSSAAAVRAGISAAREHPFMINLTARPVIGALDALLNPALMGPPRLVQLAQRAFEDACAALHHAQEERIRLPLFLGLPPERPGFAADDIAFVRQAMSRPGAAPILVSEVHLSCHGHASGLVALARAARAIATGACEVCVAGGVDSYFEPDTLDWLDASLQLAGTASRSPFVPGEGAGFCLLASEAACARWQLAPMARMRGAAVGRETCLIKTDDTCVGRGLTAAVRAAANATGEETKINDVICDINGERYRSEEWGFVCLRLGRYFDDAIGYRAPADCWGDVGAASGPLFVMLACQAAARGYSPGPRTMAWASSEDGLRCALVFDTVQLAVFG